MLFTSNTAPAGWDAANIEVMSLVDHRRKTLVRGGTFGRYLPSGHLIYMNRGTLFAVPFDLDRLEVHGTPVAGAGPSRLQLHTRLGAVRFLPNRNADLPQRRVGRRTVYRAMAGCAGKTQPLLAKPDAYMRPSLSPGRERLDWRYDGTGTTSGSTNGRRDTMTRLTFGTEHIRSPSLEP